MCPSAPKPPPPPPTPIPPPAPEPTPEAPRLTIPGRPRRSGQSPGSRRGISSLTIRRTNVNIPGASQGKGLSIPT